MTRDDIIHLARDAGFSIVEIGDQIIYRHIPSDAIERFAALVAAAEREACAKLCDLLAASVCNGNFVAIDNRKICAKHIRARSQE